MAEQSWALFDGDRMVGQVWTEGPDIPPNADGSNPGGYSEVRTERMALVGLETIDPLTGALVLVQAALDADLHRQIDAEAGAFRCRFITDMPGQELTYEQKAAEARDYLAGGSGPWPMLADPAAPLPPDMAEKAAVIVARADTWAMVKPRAERARTAAKEAVTAATTAEDKKAAAIVDWEGLIPPGETVDPMAANGVPG